MRLLLITGAGASRNLNVEASDPIVLMDGWAKALREQFGPAHSELLGLANVETGPEFEEALGELMRWLSLRPLQERFAWMTSGTDEGRDQQVINFEQALSFAWDRGQRLERDLDKSLYAQFGPDRFDVASASRAYNILLAHIGGGSARPDQLVCATTNYDRTLEEVVGSLYGTGVRTGFAYSAIHDAILDASGLGSFKPAPSVLYLHGAVGWHLTTNGVVAYPASKYVPELGRPAVLYPSNDKLVDDTVVSEIWTELDRALKESTHVLVLGHSLNDEHLVSRLQVAGGSLAVTYYDSNDQEALTTMLPDAQPVRMTFGPEPDFDRDALSAWAAGSTAVWE